MTKNRWPASPKIGVDCLAPRLLPRGNAEFVLSFPTFIASSIQVQPFLKSPEAPKQPPSPNEGNWVGSKSPVLGKRPVDSAGSEGGRREGTGRLTPHQGLQVYADSEMEHAYDS